VTLVALNVMVVGGGRVGAALTRLLMDAGHDVVVVEQRADRVAAIHAALPTVRIVENDGADPAALEAAGIRTVDVVAAVTSDDARNLLVAALARLEFQVPRTIARIIDPIHGWLFDPACGVDVALDQADLLTRLIVEEMSLGEVATLITLRRGDLRLVEERVVAGAIAEGRTVADLDLPSACMIVAVLRGDDVLPNTGDLRLREGDEVLAIVHAGTADRLTHMLGTALA
jgi:trk system potassium uptake protein